MISSQKEVFQDIYRRIHQQGHIVDSRSSGLSPKVIEVENFNYVLPPYVRFPSFAPRNLSISYIKEEFKWYLKGDLYDLSICDKAAIWKSIVYQDKLNSNYGYYAFQREGGFSWCLDELAREKYSRRAYITILDHTHLVPETKDVPCTECLGFRIRDNHLNMSVRMRSQDMIYGFGNDAPAFSFIHEMIYNALLLVYPDLQLGEYHHVADSAHIYEKHWNLLEKLVDSDVEFNEVEVPRISGPMEVVGLVTGRYGMSNLPFSKWLVS